MRRGQVRWAAAPGKRRPVVVLTRDSAVGYLTSLTVAPITTTIRRIPGEVTLGPEDGMPEACVVSCDNILTLPKHAIGSVITTLAPGKMEAIGRAVAFALGFDEWA